jgi:hypothetical protein
MGKVNATLVASLALGALASGSALAADAAFENHLTSTPMVSPAQIYQIKDLRTDFALGYTSQSDEMKTDGGKATDDLTGTRIFAAGIYNIQSIGLRAGATIDYGMASSESKVTGSDKSTDDLTAATLSPQVAYPAGPVVIGAAVDIKSVSMKPEEGKTADRTYTTFRPGVLFADNGLEAGVTYASRNHLQRKVNDDGEMTELGIEEPATTTIHGRYAVSHGMAFGGIVGFNNYQGINDDLYKTQTTVRATGEFDVASVKVEGDLGYNTAYNKNDEALDQTTMGTYEVGAGADYSLSQAAKVGGALGYEFGSDSATVGGVKTDYKANALSVLVRGDMSF